MTLLTSKPMTWFKKAANIRSKTRTGQELEQLAASLQARQITPLIASEDGTLIDGYQRLDAALHAGIPDLDVIITDEPLTPQKIAAIQFESSIHRDDLSAYDKWQGLLLIKQAHPGKNNEALAAQVHCNAGMITRILAAGNCIPEAQEQFKLGKLNASQMYAISRSPNQARALVEALRGATRKQMEEALHDELDADHAERDGRKPVTLTIRLAGGATLVLKKQGLDLPQALDALKEASFKVEAVKHLKPDTAMKVWEETGDTPAPRKRGRRRAG